MSNAPPTGEARAKALKERYVAEGQALKERASPEAQAAASEYFAGHFLTNCATYDAFLAGAEWQRNALSAPAKPSAETPKLCCGGPLPAVFAPVTCEGCPSDTVWDSENLSEHPSYDHDFQPQWGDKAKPSAEVSEPRAVETRKCAACDCRCTWVSCTRCGHPQNLAPLQKSAEVSELVADLLEGAERLDEIEWTDCARDARRAAEALSANITEAASREAMRLNVAQYAPTIADVHEGHIITEETVADDFRAGWLACHRWFSAALAALQTNASH